MKKINSKFWLVFLGMFVFVSASIVRAASTDTVRQSTSSAVQQISTSTVKPPCDECDQPSPVASPTALPPLLESTAQIESAPAPEIVILSTRNPQALIGAIYPDASTQRRIMGVLREGLDLLAKNRGKEARKSMERFIVKSQRIDVQSTACLLVGDSYEKDADIKKAREFWTHALQLSPPATREYIAAARRIEDIKDYEMRLEKLRIIEGF